MSTKKLPLEQKQGGMLLKCFQESQGKVVFYNELIDCVGLTSRQELYQLVYELRREHYIETVYQEGFIYWGKQDKYTQQGENVQFMKGKV